MGKIVEFIFCVRIALSPIAAAICAALALHYSYPDKEWVNYANTGILAVGILAGVRWAIAIHKREGAMEFMSRVNATPELDHHDEPLIHITLFGQALEFQRGEAYVLFSRHKGVEELLRDSLKNHALVSINMGHDIIVPYKTKEYSPLRDQYLRRIEEYIGRGKVLLLGTAGLAPDSTYHFIAHTYTLAKQVDCTIIWFTPEHSRVIYPDLHVAHLQSPDTAQVEALFKSVEKENPDDVPFSSKPR